MLLAILTTSPATSATITTEKINEDLTVISITGPIEDGDGRTFLKERHKVQLPLR